MSPSPPPLLLALDRDPHYPGLLALTLPFRVERVSSWRMLYHRAAAAPPSTVICVDPYFGARYPQMADELRGLRLLLPSARVAAAVDLSTAPPEDLLELGRLGVAEVVGRAPADVRRAMERIQVLAQPRLVARIDHACEGRIDPGVRALIRTAVELAGLGPQATTLARRLYVTERTLLRACTRMGIPGPNRLMAWTRVLHAVALLDEPGRRVRDAARAAGFGSDRSLRRALHRHLGCGVGQLRRGGAFPRAVRRFLRVLSRTAAAERAPVAPPPRDEGTGGPLA